MSEQEKTAEQLEAEAAEMLAKVAALKAKKRAKTGKAPVREGDTLRRIQQDQTVKSATLAKSFGGYGGRTLISKIEEQMDQRRKVMESIVVKTGETSSNANWLKNKHRREGMAAALAILRSSSVAHELQRSDERLGIDG
ncbi:hypothetical protein PBI_ROPE_80 [Mycobacterium phage Rope]|uniref:Uncharacterized protein n=1 Tax=Mycobacterium phage Rope TaxID=2767563 RepID=A0A7G9V0D4_9CAUD|nr:hypothetical protein PBI_ROPE_80 [Mycobacterium phage Rope]